MSRAAATWTCPVCDRRVPRREPECFCGARRERAEEQRLKQAARTTRRIPRDVAALLLGLALVGVYGIHRLTREPEEDAFAQAAQRTLGGPFVAPEGSPAQAKEPQRPATEAASVPARAADLRPPPALASPGEPPSPAPALIDRPAPSPAASPADEQEQKRLAGISDYEGALLKLQPLAAKLAEHVRVFRTECLGEVQKLRYVVINCQEIESSIRRSAIDIELGLDSAEDVARRAWVEPGAVRDIRARSFFGTRDWDQLLRSAQDPRH